MIFRQLFDRESSTYTYLLGDSTSRRAVLIDPVIGNLERDLQLINDLDLTLEYALDTHVHADHVTAAGELRTRTHAKTNVGDKAVVCADLQLQDGDKLHLGDDLEIEVNATPGHTIGCLTYVAREAGRTLAFTGDALLIRGSGRTDFQGGDAATLYRSVRGKIFTLPDNTEIYPGHDYRGNTSSSVQEERAHNPRLKDGISESTFVQIMAELNLPNPKMMDVAVPANMACGKEVSIS